jgi:hypothetical protein
MDDKEESPVQEQEPTQEPTPTPLTQAQVALKALYEINTIQTRALAEIADMDLVWARSQREKT